MARNVFRQRWFPRRNSRLFNPKDAAIVFSGVQAASVVGAFRIELDPAITGQQSTSQFGALSETITSSLSGVAATTQFGSLTVEVDSSFNLTGQFATAQVGPLTGDHPAKLLVGVTATTQIGSLNVQGDHRLFGVQAFTQVPDHPFFQSTNVNLIGQQVQALSIASLPAGGGGGGAGGPNGHGFAGANASSDGIGAAGGAGDGGVVPGQTTPGATGNSGTEFDGSIGVGSGGAGASAYDNTGGNGGLYGGGGAGGTGVGGGVGGDAVVVLRWFAGIWQEIVLHVSDNASSPLILPADWSNTNFVYILSSGGCGSAGTHLSGGNGGGGGSLLWGQNVPVFSPGQVITYHISPGCEGGSTSFGDYSVENGGNATNTAAGLAGTHYTSWPGGTFSGGSGGTIGHSGEGIGGSGGGSLIGFSYTGTIANPFSVFATAQVASFSLAGVPGNRTFIISSIEQKPIPPGIVMLPTSEAIGYGPTAPYILGSSQFYTIGEVHWNGVKKTEGVHWEFVSPFKHIIHILIPAGIVTPITLIYSRWDIGVRSGFKVNSYPVSFGFTGTTIIAEQLPSTGQFFTVEYTSIRPGDNPRSMFAIFPRMVDDLLSDHTLYDSPQGFQTFRPDGYKVFDTGDNHVWAWNGIAMTWSSLGPYPNATIFYVKRLRKVYEYVGGMPVLQYTAGDGTSSIDQVLNAPDRPYPLFGESIGKNFLVDAFSPTAEIDFPAAFEVAENPGNYDPWVPEIDS